MKTLSWLIVAALCLIGCGGMGAEQLHGRWVENVPANANGTYVQKQYAEAGIEGGTFTYIVGDRDIRWIVEPAVPHMAAGGPWTYVAEGSGDRFVLVITNDDNKVLRVNVVLIDANTAEIYMRDPEGSGDNWGPFIVRREGTARGSAGAR